MSIDLMTTKGRLICFLSGIVCFGSICAVLSPDTWTNSQVVGAALYFTAGAMLFRGKGIVGLYLIFFSPFILPVVIMLTGNPNLFPLFIPVLFGVCLCAFVAGQYVRHLVASGRLLLGGICLVSFGIVSLLTILIVTPLLGSFRVSDHFVSPELPGKIELVNLERDTIELEKDHVKVLDFWFSACGNCYPNNDFLNTLAGQYKGLGVEFYLINMGNIDSFKKFQGIDLTKRNWTDLIHLHDPNGELSNKLGINSAPRTLIIADGKILFSKSGYNIEHSDFDAKRMSKIIDAELKRINEGINFKVENSYDFGKISLDDTLFYTFKVKSLGNVPLLLKDIESSCNCFAVEWTKIPIYHGDIGEVTVRFVAKEKGAFDKIIVIATNSIKEPFIVLHLKGEV